MRTRDLVLGLAALSVQVVAAIVLATTWALLVLAVCIALVAVL